MGKQSFRDRVREFIGGIAWDVFLWSIRMTTEQYLDVIYAQEKEYRENGGED